MRLKRILLINPFGIGDVLFTTPVVSNLRRAHPQANIAYLANRRAQEVLRHNPYINKIFIYERDEFAAVHRRNPLAFYAKWFALLAEIKREKFDVVFDFSLNPTFGFLAFVCGIARRIGFDYRGRGRFLTDKIPLAGYEGKHVVAYYLDLLASVGVPVVDRQMTLNVPVEETQWAQEWLKSNGVDTQRPLVAVAPGGGASWGADAQFKRWPAAKYAQLVDKIIANQDAVIILLGDRKEEPLCREVARLASAPVRCAAGQTTITQMAAIVQRCRLAIVNDGGPLHVAAAAGTKTISLFGPVDPRVYGPYPLNGHTVVAKGIACQPCYRNFRMAACGHIHCLHALAVEDVYRKVEQSL